jgi:orotidine-5'-phosphate decarboxylase
MTAFEKLRLKNKELKYICVGLDTDINKIPNHLKDMEDPILNFNKEIIESTSEYAAAYKLNFAFYEKLGERGFEILKKTISHIPDTVLIIGDAKRGDIGNTSEMYADSVFNYLKCDAVTLNPYMGEDSLLPFLNKKDKMNFILALTSNPGAQDFEKLKLEGGEFLYQKIISKVKEWNRNKNCGIVFGATQIKELQENIDSFDELPVLLPGIGAQGGNLTDVIKSFKEKNKLNFLINVSRGIIYKGKDENFAESAKTELINLNKEINSILI